MSAERKSPCEWPACKCDGAARAKCWTDERIIDGLRHLVDVYGEMHADAATRAIAVIDRLRMALKRSEQTNRDWLRANAPGGWIDDLRRLSDNQ